MKTTRAMQFVCGLAVLSAAPALLILAIPRITRAQEITIAVPIHPRYEQQHGYSPTLPMMTWQGSTNQTGNISEWRDRQGNPTCWADYDGHLNCVGGGILTPGLVNIYHNGVLVGTEPGLNIVDGSNVTLSPFVDNPGSSRVDLTVNATGGGSDSCTLGLPLYVFTSSDCTGDFQTQAAGSVFAGPVKTGGPQDDSFVQSVARSSLVSPGPMATLALPFGSPNVAGPGHKIVVILADACYPNCFGAAFSVFDSAGNAYTQVATWGNQKILGSIFTAPINTDGPNTVTATVTGAGGPIFSAVAEEFYNLGDYDSVATAGNFTVGNWTATVTTSDTHDILIGGALSKAGFQPPIFDLALENPTGWNTRADVIQDCSPLAGGQSCLSEYIVTDQVTAGPGNYSITFNYIGGGWIDYASGAFLVAFKPYSPNFDDPAKPFFRHTARSDLPDGVLPYSTLTTSIGGSALAAGQCATGTVTLRGVNNTMDAHATPETDPGDAFYWKAFVSAQDTVMVKVCAVVGGTPAASLYNVRVWQ